LKLARKIIIITLIFLIGFSFGQTAAAFDVKIQTPSIPAALPFLWMQQEGDLPAALNLDVQLSSEHQRGMSLLAQNEINFLITGSNVGANAYNRGVKLKLLNVNTWGIDYLLSNGLEINTWQDLEGKSLALPLKGGPLDFLARYLLKNNGADLTKVNFVYRALPGSAKLFMAGKLDAIFLPEPLVTVSLAKNKQAKLVMDIQQEWARLNNDERIPFVALFVNSDFAAENPQFTVIINSYYKKGVIWVNQHPDAAAKLAAENFSLPESIFKKSLTRVNLNIYPAAESKNLTDFYFSKMLNFNPELLGGSLPDEEFYY
jgi:NitT/TauT family transport system substrate-binding protein